jgi:hypothetical protein
MKSEHHQPTVLEPWTTCLVCGKGVTVDLRTMTFVEHGTAKRGRIHSCPNGGKPIPK